MYIYKLQSTDTLFIKIFIGIFSPPPLPDAETFSLQSSFPEEDLVETPKEDYKELVDKNNNKNKTD